MDKQTIEALEKSILQLSESEQMELIERIFRNLRKKMVHQETSFELKNYYGISKGLWKKDAQSYIGNLREERT